ncbi:hypothetical protein [Pseudokineococcus sp. 1T1Z-3]|uniref:hypothetical protein n=1 Tax=Pseudokineococcus sp. 1T1Z-3 TaxID=3132745 RepID=UPI0030AD0052
MPSLRVRFPVFGEIGDVEGDVDLDLDAARRIFADEFADLASREGVNAVRVEESQTGVGASGYAFEVVIEVSRLVIDDMSRLIAFGGWVLWLVDKVRRRRGDAAPPTVSDSTTLGAVAAAWVAPSTDLTGRFFVGSQRLNGQQLAPDETDERIVWASAFQDEDRGDLLIVFLSSDLVVLGQVLVPIRLHFGGPDGYELRSGSEARRLFREWNGFGGHAPG